MNRSGAELLALVAQRLSELEPPVVFLGGATTHLFITDPGAEMPSATKDVDVIVDIDSTVAYSVKLREQLRRLGAREDTREDAPACRWLLDDVIVDVMPTNPGILGFSSRWYRDAAATSVEVEVAGVAIRRVTAPYFVATKAEAFFDRANGDYLSSKDLEDVIAVVDGRIELLDEVGAAAASLRDFVAKTFSEWLCQPGFKNAVEGYLRGESDRVELVLSRAKALASL